MASELTLPQRLRVYAATLSAGETVEISFHSDDLRSLAQLCERYEALEEFQRALENKESAIDDLKHTYKQAAASAKDARKRFETTHKLVLALLPLQLAIFLLIWWIS